MRIRVSAHERVDEEKNKATETHHPFKFIYKVGAFLLGGENGDPLSWCVRKGVVMCARVHELGGETTVQPNPDQLPKAGAHFMNDNIN